MQINENARLCSFLKYRNHTVTALLISTMNNKYSTRTSNTSCCKAPTSLDVTISTASGPF